MAHESFENESVAKFLNDHFVSIKVDREERPDIDQIYMNAVQMMTGRGGWPMSVFLDHDRKPFYAGTYLPPTQKFGMPGFSQVLDALVDAWNNRRDEVKKHSSEITAALEKLATGTTRSADSVPNETVIKNATEHLLCVLDRTDGGFERAPKFPHATDLDLLLRRGFDEISARLDRSGRTDAGSHGWRRHLRFHCSQDADSEGVEGKFYVWKPAEIKQVLGPERAQKFCEAYDISEAGNFEGSSIPNLRWPIDPSEFADDRESLRLARDMRIHPGRDDKILTAWNALAIKALAVGGAVFNESRYLKAAQRAAEFSLQQMTPR